MRRSSAWTLLLSTIVILTMSLTTAYAEQCVTSRLGAGTNFCNDCTFRILLGVKKDQPCSRIVAVPNGTVQRPQLIASRVTQRAAHGIGGVSGVTLAYAPNKNYVGPDNFVVAFDFKDQHGSGKVFFDIAVTVQ